MKNGMEKFLESVKTSSELHHAYFFMGNVAEIQEALLNFFDKKLKIVPTGNPDFKLLNFQNLSIDEARSIREDSEKKNFSDKMIFVISFETISHEAQNSLLKVLEEPVSDTHFFLVSPQDTLLPTLKSRINVVDARSFESDVKKLGGILKLTFKERLDRVKEIVESISDENSTKQSAIDFVNNLESEIYDKGIENNYQKINSCELAREYLLDRGAPVKMILENLVLSV